MKSQWKMVNWSTMVPMTSKEYSQGHRPYGIGLFLVIQLSINLNAKLIKFSKLDENMNVQSKDQKDKTWKNQNS